MRIPLGFAGSAAFVLGVALGSTGIAATAIVLLAGLIIIAWIWIEDLKVLVFGGVFLVLVVLGFLRVAGTDQYPTPPTALDSATEFSGRVLDVPRRYPTATYTRIELEQPASTRVFATLSPYPDVEQGDQLTLRGTFVPNSETSFRGFSARRDTSGLLNSERHTKQGNDASTLQGWRAAIAGEVGTQLRTRIPEPAGAFSTGVLLGDDGAMTEATRHSFRVGGLTHMTAVSGVHVGIIAAAILLLSRLGIVSRWWTLTLSVPLIWSFAYIVGMRPSVVRASIMLTLLVIASLLGRPRDTLNAVGLAAVVMLVVEPSFRHDIAFQLSVAATTGIALGILLLGRRSHWHLVWVVPVSAQLATEPLILYHFGYYSIVSPFANILAAPLLAMTMALGLLTVVLSLVSGLLADAMALATWVPAYAVVLIADYAASIPYLSEDVPQLSLTVVWVTYAILAALVAALFLVLDHSMNDGEGDFSALYRI